MKEFSCLFQTDMMGNLVHYNEYPELVNKLFDAKQMLAELGYNCDDLLVVGKLQAELEKNAGRGFGKWIEEERARLLFEAKHDFRSMDIKVKSFEEHCILEKVEDTIRKIILGSE